jgi:hypothetical protein
MRKIALAISLVLVAATAFAFVDGDEGLREMTLQRHQGEVSVLRGDRLIEVTDESGIEPGDRIRTGPGGRAELRLEGERRIELAPDSRVDVVDTASVDGVGGSLLAAAEDGDDLSIGFGTVAARTNAGRFRVDLGTGSSRVGVYEGSASIVAPGETAERIERYFEAEVAGNDRTLEARPLQIDEGDAWDQFHLDDVFLLDERITQLGNGLATQLGGARPGRGYFSDLVDAPVNFIDTYLQREGVPDVLIGFTIARNTTSPLAAAFEESFDYRNQGGRWGLIARIMSARENRLVAQLGQTIIDTGILADASENRGFGPESRLGGGRGASNSGSSGNTGGPGDSGGGSSPTGPGTGGENPPDGGGRGDPDPGTEPPKNEDCNVSNVGGCLKDPVGGLLGEGGLLDDGLIGDDGILDGNGLLGDDGLLP